jgi:DNA-binding MarR family transcriptional regulator
MPDSTTEPERQRLTKLIVDMEKDLYWHIRAGSFDHWLHIDVTMPQLKTLILVYGSPSGCARMGQLAGSLGVALSTATGIVDRLVDQGLLVRQEDPEDRRLVVVRLSPKGRETVERPHQKSLERLTASLRRMSADDLRMLAHALASLHEAARQAWPQAGSAWQADAAASLAAALDVPLTADGI